MSVLAKATDTMFRYRDAEETFNFTCGWKPFQSPTDTRNMVGFPKLGYHFGGSYNKYNKWNIDSGPLNVGKLPYQQQRQVWQNEKPSRSSNRLEALQVRNQYLFCYYSCYCHVDCY